MEHADYLIIGGGVASAQAAVAIRESDKEGSVTLLCGEKWNPTDRPPLSKDFLTNWEMKPDDPESKAPEWYPNNKVDLRTGDRVEKIDAAKRQVTTQSGRVFEYKKLLLATGGHAIQPKGTFPAEAKIFTLRSVDDAIKIREAIKSSKTGICVGSGFIGLEVSASAASKGVHMTVISLDKTPWSHIASESVGQWIQKQCESQGVKFQMNTGVAEIGWSNGKAWAKSNEGQTFEADFLVFGVGAHPNVELGEQAGLEIADHAIKVDAQMKSSDPHIYAAGDCAAIVEPITGDQWRTQHYMDASAQGALAGANMAGGANPYSSVAYFFSDVFDIHMGMRGYMKGSHHHGLIGQLDGKSFVELSARENGELASGLIMCSDYNDLDPISDRLEPLIRAKVKASEVTAQDLGI